MYRNFSPWASICQIRSVRGAADLPFFDFVQQRPVANVQMTGRLPAIPIRLLQH
jgi:hypothetical protein